jgi:hypothetical protein
MIVRRGHMKIQLLAPDVLVNAVPKGDGVVVAVQGPGFET